MVPLEALIFDVDGTLAETEEVHRQAFNATFAAFGLAWHWDRALYAVLLKVTGGKERILHYVAGWQPPGGAAAAGQVAALHAAKTARYVALVEDGRIALRPGVGRLLAEARAAGLKLAIATTTSRPNVDSLIRATLGAEASALFDAVAAGDMVAAKKPAPDIYRLALAQLGSPATGCIAFKDSANGVRSAAAAGLAVVATPGLYSAHDDLSGAAVCHDDLSTVDLDSLRRLLAGRR